MPDDQTPARRYLRLAKECPTPVEGNRGAPILGPHNPERAAHSRAERSKAQACHVRSRQGWSALGRVGPRPAADVSVAQLIAYGFAGLASVAAAVALARRSHPTGSEPNRHTQLAQLDGTPLRRYYTGLDPQRAIAVSDLRAMTHKRLPRFALEYLEGGAQDEASMMRERRSFADWRFVPRNSCRRKLPDASGSNSRSFAAKAAGK